MSIETERPDLRDRMGEAERAIEFGEYLAQAAESFQAGINLANGTLSDETTDAWRRLSSAIYEFRKRARRAAPNPGGLGQ